jgi:hypothetical protein
MWERVELEGPFGPGCYLKLTIAVRSPENDQTDQKKKRTNLPYLEDPELLGVPGCEGKRVGHVFRLLGTVGRTENATLVQEIPIEKIDLSPADL